MNKYHYTDEATTKIYILEIIESLRIQQQLHVAVKYINIHIQMAKTENDDHNPLDDCQSKQYAYHQIECIYVF